MARRTNGLRGGKSRVQTRPKLRAESLDYHEGLSGNQVKIILREFGFTDKHLAEFNGWMFGQTCPVVKRRDNRGAVVDVGGVYEWDLFRWISFKKTGVAPVWD